MEPNDPSKMRISDQDRHQVAEVLRDAAAEGRIDLEELDERLEAAYKAKFYADLVPLTLDLPGAHLPAVGPTAVPQPGQTSGPPVGGVPARVHETSIAVMSGVDRKGVWRVPAQHTAVALMGGVTIDLREAVFSAREVVINAHAVMGAVDVHVNAGTQVIVEGIGIMGAFEQDRDRVPAAYDASSPVVRVKGLALMGAVTVTRKRMPGEPGPFKKMLGH